MNEKNLCSLQIASNDVHIFAIASNTMLQCTTEVRCGVLIVVSIALVLSVFIYPMLIVTLIKHRHTYFKGVFYKLFILNFIWDAVRNNTHTLREI
jgi:hypothetical protein